MQFTSEVLQCKPPSLEEGPMKCSAHNENCVVYRVEKRSIFQKCIEIIKLILLLEVIFFVAWLGRILISNYHLEYNKDITAHDPFLNNLVGNDFPVTLNSISNDKLVIRDANGISSTERSQISTVPGLNAAFPNTEEYTEYGDNEWPWFKRDREVLDQDNEWPLNIFYGKNVFPNSPLDTVDIDIFDGNTESKKAELDSPSVKITDDLEAPSLLLSNVGLIHVIQDRMYDSNDDTNRESEVPFPLFEFLSNSKDADEEKSTENRDTSDSNDTTKSSNTSDSNDTTKSSNTSETNDTSEHSNPSDNNDTTGSSNKSNMDSQMKSIFDLNWSGFE